MIAHIFGGSGLVDNMVPMNGKLVNLAEYMVLENEWRTALKADKEVEVRINHSKETVIGQVHFELDGERKSMLTKNP
ncbi:DNA/RNA non-specific endonuclease [Fictibacillus enclensis]|uniref:DNA/RNA non-specific endonuclease n=1 Tax=Fictibacillus enclensis TaxID=1017270 RepID=UPI0025A109EE|nr:DNA/RNA non-specific endonuclease [Fictibacillus enclensis]MDM5336419.1 DNA/RNA non-specific endonuclease [Fictibacillus enclensis]